MTATAETLHVAERDNFLSLLSGKGIEIGALHRPCLVPFLKVRYVDRLSKKDLLEQYPELKEFPIVEADILDDAETLASLADNSEDFVIANHVIEHMANPISALLNWGRVLKSGGHLFLAAPDKRFTFDKEREITTIDHIALDFTNPCKERDFEHFLEFALHVSCRTYNVRPETEYREFAQHLWDINYSIHYHVWDFTAFFEFLNWVSENIPGWCFKIQAAMKPINDEFIFVLRKV